MRCRARVKKSQRPGFLPPESERSATAVDNGRRRWPNPSLQALVPMDLPVEKFFLHQHTRSTQDRLNENLPHRHFRSSEGGLRTQNRGEDLESSLRGAPTKWLSLPSGIRAMKARTVGNKNEKKCSRTSVDVWPNKRLAHQVVSNPLTPHTLT